MCGLDSLDCGPIEGGAVCFEPDTVRSHAAYAMNAYYQSNGRDDVACDFGATAALTTNDPSKQSIPTPNQLILCIIEVLTLSLFFYAMKNVGIHTASSNPIKFWILYFMILFLSA